MTAPAVAKDHIDTDAPGYTGAAERDTNTNDIVQQQAFRRWYWLGVPGLAVAAYLSVLRIGFLSDDLLMLFTSKLKGFSIATILPSPTWTFLRPVGTVITWQAGWQLFGSNPFPYHLVGLVLHALASLALALWLAEATHRPIMGWLAGALFAVLPLHTEAVGWLAAQWDAWAAMFGLFALWLFTRWWSGRRTTDDH